MQAQVIASMIVDALLEDEKPESGGYDLTAGMFGPAFSKVIREIACQNVSDSERIAKLEAEMADLIHPHDLAAYRAKRGEVPT